ncbi:hypothetical protein D3C71_1799750 [compost metagenome]
MLIDELAQVGQPAAFHIIVDGVQIVRKHNIGSIVGGHQHVQLIHLLIPGNRHKLQLDVIRIAEILLDPLGPEIIVHGTGAGRSIPPVEYLHLQGDRILACR